MPSSLPPNEDIAWKVWVGSIVGVVISTIAVTARVIARRLSAAHFWWDDWLIIAALVGMTISVILSSGETDSLPGSTMGHGHY